jgi:dimethylhistidine N-methyltransferase
MRTRLRPRIAFYDQHPAPQDFFGEVIDGLRRRPRRIAPKFFYDEEGSRLFEAICATPEYYPTRTEKQLLAEHADDIARLMGRGCLLVEPGSGSSDKVRLLLDALQPRGYLPLDISKDYLVAAATQLSAEYPWLEVHAACVDFTGPIELPFCPPQARRVAFFPGSSIGNFDPDDAVVFLRNIARMVGRDGGLLIGVDLKKPVEILEAAYNDAQGVTAAFNLNLLARINRELGANFDPRRFTHRAFYNAERGRIEMHLVSTTAQRAQIGREKFVFEKGESIHTENSYKYTVAGFHELAARAGFGPRHVWCDTGDLFSIHYLETRH